MKTPFVLLKRHQHYWKDVERTLDWTGDVISRSHGVYHTIQYLLQWCESCGSYRQVRVKGESLCGPPPLRTPAPPAVSSFLGPNQ